MARDITFDIIARDKASKVFDKVGSASHGLERRFGGVGKVAAVGFGAATAAAAALTTGIGVSITKAMDYDKTMRMVGATLGTTGEQQKSLGKLALKMGADTVFSAADAGNAMLELAKGGLTAAQIEGGALNATMTLAAAGTLEMGSAATYVGNALNAFGLKAKDANAVAAALAGGANRSSASVESLGLALSQVGPGARDAGLSIQTTTAILAAFDNAGIKGSDAGTALKTMLARLVPTTKKAAAEMKDLGLKFTDSKGNFVSMANVAEQLKAKLGGLTDAERTQSLETIFGSDARRAALVMMNLGAKGVEDYTKATSDQAAAQKMANTQMEGASGAWEAFKGSVETLAISVGQKLLPSFTRMVKWLTEFTNSIESKAGPTVRRFSNWFKGDLWPALQKGYQTIMPGIRDALRIVSGGLEGNTMTWKRFGEIITRNVIPTLAFVTRNVLPIVALNIRICIDAVKAAIAPFVFWGTVTSRVTSMIVKGIGVVMDAFAAMLRALSHVPGFGWAKDAAAKMQNAADKAHNISRAIAAIPNSKTVTVNVMSRVTSGRASDGHGGHINLGLVGDAPPKRARGGPVGRGRSYWVGEEGPELITPRSDGMVLPADLSAQLRNGFGGGDQNVTVQLVLDGKVIQQSLLKLKRQGGVTLGLA